MKNFWIKQVNISHKQVVNLLMQLAHVEDFAVEDWILFKHETKVVKIHPKIRFNIKTLSFKDTEGLNTELLNDLLEVISKNESFWNSLETFDVRGTILAELHNESEIINIFIFYGIILQTVTGALKKLSKWVTIFNLHRNKLGISKIKLFDFSY